MVFRKNFRLILLLLFHRRKLNVLPCSLMFIIMGLVVWFNCYTMYFSKFQDAIKSQRFSQTAKVESCDLCATLKSLICKWGVVCAPQTHNYISIFLRCKGLVLMLLRRRQRLPLLHISHLDTQKC